MSLENQCKGITELHSHRGGIIASWHLPVLNKALNLTGEVISEYKRLFSGVIRCLCVRMCVFLCLLHTEYQKAHSTGKKSFPFL